MKLHHCISILTFLALGLASCSSDSPEPAPTDSSCELVVTLDTGDTGTRADIDRPWGDPYPEEAAVAFENAVSNVAVYFVTPDDVVIALQATGPGGTGGSYTYRTRVNVNSSFVKDNGNGNYSISGRIVAVANCPGPAPASPFSIPAFSIIDMRRKELIPMWGVTTVTDLPLRINKTSDAGTVKLLRAVPKITIAMRDDFADLYKITKVTTDSDDWLLYANCTPAAASTAKTTDELMREGCFNPSDRTEEDYLPFYGEGTDKVWCYPAERQGSTTATPTSLTVTLERKDGSDAPFTGKVYLCDYDEHGLPDFSSAFPALVRNHDYRYTIALSELQFLVSVKRWEFGGKTHLELE